MQSMSKECITLYIVTNTQYSVIFSNDSSKAIILYRNPKVIVEEGIGLRRPQDPNVNIDEEVRLYHMICLNPEKAFESIL